MKSEQESSEDIAIRVLQAAAESTTEQITAEGTKRVLAELISSALAGPAAAVIAAVAKTLVEELFKQTNEIEAKLDRILTEPMANAVNTLTETLSARFETEEEFAECNRRLAVADDSLRVAYEYARKNDGGKLTLIREYQALVAALLDGGRPYLTLYLQDLRSLANRANAEFPKAAAEADRLEVQNRSEMKSEMNRPRDPRRRGLRRMVPSMPARTGVWAARESRIERLRVKANRLSQGAEQIELFCLLVEQAAFLREQLLRSPK